MLQVTSVSCSQGDNSSNMAAAKLNLKHSFDMQELAPALVRGWNTDTLD